MRIIFNWGEPLSKKQRKKLLQKKNKHHQIIFHLMRLRHIEAARIKEMNEARDKKRAENKSEKEWHGKVASVRNRLTNKKRDSKERWNRFAGTGDAGGRGL